MLKMTFLDYVDEYMYYCKSKQLRPKTLSSYEQTLILFNKWLENNDIKHTEDITNRIVLSYIDDIKNRGKYTVLVNSDSHKTNYPNRRRDFRNQVSITTINNYIRNLKAFFNWMEEENDLKNPMKRIKLFPNKHKPKDFISDEDFNKLISVFDKSYFNEYRDYCIIILLLDTGMRIGECTRILMDDLDLQNCCINLRATETKGKKDRTVFFSTQTQKILKRWINYKDRYTETDYLFCTKANNSPVTISGFESNFKSYIKRAELKETISPHTLRNNFAKRCLMNGMDIYTLSRILGHSSVKVTEQAYLDLTSSDLRNNYVKFSPVANLKRY